MKNLVCASILIGVTAINANSQNSLTLEMFPVTSNILMLHLDEGYVDYAELGEPLNGDIVIKSPLDTITSMSQNTYTLYSANDPNFDIPNHPMDVFRKSKASDYANICDWTGWECSPNDDYVVQEHWIYLHLNNSLQQGASYELTIENIGSGQQTINFVYEPDNMRSEAVHVNLIGYVTSAEKKFGYVYHWMGNGGACDFSAYDNQPFYIINTDNDQISYTGNVTFRKPIDNSEFAYAWQSPPNGNLTGAAVYECDFSSFTTPGDYKLVVENLGSSFPFQIGCDIYRPVYHSLLKGLYHQRSGIERTSEFSNFPKPADHNVNLTPGFETCLHYTTARYCDYIGSDASQDDTTTIQMGDLGLINTWGWYHDAGDWDTYYSHSNVPTSLMMLYEIAGDKVDEDDVNIPESGNDFPDLLDEAMWQLRYYYRTRHAIMDAGYGTGGVGGARTFGDLWGPDILGDERKASWQDTHRNWYVSGEDPFMTYKYAALAAQMAFIISSNNLNEPSGINWQEEAEETYAWSETHTLAGDEIPRFDGELDLSVTRMCAAASLYRTTNNQEYHDDFLVIVDSVYAANEYYNNDFRLSEFIYLKLPPSVTPNLSAINLVSNTLQQEAHFNMIDFYDNRACRWAGNYWYNMQVGHQTTPIILPGVLATHLNVGSDANEYLQNTLTTADYFMGTNPLNMSWITGPNLSERQPKNVFSLDNFALNESEMYPGVIPYGTWYSTYFGPLGAWNINWGGQYIYPTTIDSWPGHERWWNNRNAPLNSEYTVHQGHAVGILTYGSLCGICQDPASVTETSSNIELLQVFPNPANEQATIILKTPNKNIDFIEAIDLAGRHTFISSKQKTSSNERMIIPLNTSSLQTGAYIIKIRYTDGQDSFGKLVIAR
jgi:endoglucanase